MASEGEKQGHGEDSGPRYFFDPGLHFACQRCGHCCTGGTGIVRILDNEIADAARFLGITPAAFEADHCHRVGDIRSLRERGNGDCVFYDRGCTIYPVRPAQCRTFPFWIKNLRSEEAWRDAARECPGIGQGPLHDRETILGVVRDSPV